MKMRTLISKEFCVLYMKMTQALWTACENTPDTKRKKNCQKKRETNNLNVYDFATITNKKCDKI